MTPEKTDGLVLRVTEFSETSCIVWWFTRDFGRIDTLAKGARRRRNPFEGALDLLAFSRLVFLRKSSESLDLLTEAKLERLFRAGRTSLERLHCGYHIVELLSRWFDRYDAHPAFFDRTMAAVQGIEHGSDLARIVTGFELDLLQAVGQAPSWRRCVNCDSPALMEGTRVAFSALEGGVICRACRSGKTQVIAVRQRVIEYLERLGVSGAELPQSTDEMQGSWGEIRGLMGQLLLHRTGQTLRVLPMLRFLAHPRNSR